MSDKWLSQYKNEMFIGARNNNLCSYLIALEGWRRGLTLTWYSERVKGGSVHAPGRAYSLSDGKKTHYFYKAKGDKVSNEAISIGKDKEKTKIRLAQNNIPVPQGKQFDEITSNEEIITYCNENIKYPVVIKPTDGVQGKGVVANIEDEETLIKAIQHVRNELNYKDIILESFVEGEEFRFFVIENEVKAIIKRTPANVIGNGEHTIQQLINIKNKERKQNPRLYNCLIKIDFELKTNLERQGLNLNDIPDNGKQVMLRVKSNISTGGDSEDVLETMPNRMKQLAIDTLKAMPELPHGGVDIIVSFTENEVKGTVLEINAIPQIGSLVFPMNGHARDIPSAIIDYYFPDTKKMPRNNDYLYFDFKTVLSTLQNRVVSEAVVTPAPRWKTYITKKYIIEGNLQHVRYRRWIQRMALANELYGYVRKLNKNSIEIVIAGETNEVEAFKQTCFDVLFADNTVKVKEVNWERPVKVGFEIKSDKKLINPRINSENNKVKDSKSSLVKVFTKRLFKR